MLRFRCGIDWRGQQPVNLIRVAFLPPTRDHQCLQISLAGFSLYVHRWVFK